MEACAAPNLELNLREKSPANSGMFKEAENHFEAQAAVDAVEMSAQLKTIAVGGY